MSSAAPLCAGAATIGRTATPGDGPVELVVLVNGFPRLSETFVLQELLELERHGVRLLVVALSDPGEVVTQDDLRCLRARVVHLPLAIETPRRRKTRAHASLLERRGRRYLAARIGLRGSPDWTQGALDRSALLASQLVRMGSPPLYVHFAHKPATIGRFAALMAGVPYALSCHAKDIWLTPAAELAAKIRDAELVLTCTAQGRDELQRHAGGVTPVRLAYHGVEVDVDCMRRVAAGPPRILTVGRLVEKKGHDTLIHAAALLRDRGLAFTVRIVGEGVEWPRLQRLVHELDLAGHVSFLGPLSPAEVQQEYASAAVFALACRQLGSGDRDGLPNVVMEAMVHSRPIVSTAQAGVGEAIDDELSGLLVAVDDPCALADALERVLVDPDLARRLGDGARAAVAARFDRRRLLPQVARALAQAGLIGRPGSNSGIVGAAAEQREAA